MNFEIEKDGTLVFKVEKDVEEYALRRWFEDTLDINDMDSYTYIRVENAQDMVYEEVRKI